MKRVKAISSSRGDATQNMTFTENEGSAASASKKNRTFGPNSNVNQSVSFALLQPEISQIQCKCVRLCMFACISLHLIPQTE
jgi:hypothetical protein